MQEKQEKKGKEKSKLHPRNKNADRYDFKELIKNYKDLEKYVSVNKFNSETIDFANPKAVIALNKAILKTYYNIDYWDIPENYLCPPIPGRADYLHYVADLLSSNNSNEIPLGDKLTVLDLGIGANCIYPIIGRAEYGWSFMGSEIDKVALDSAKSIISRNKLLQGKVDCRFQKSNKDYFYGILDRNEKLDVVICNPPFHSSEQEARKGSLRKVNNLNKTKTNKLALNFGGNSTELWCEGGERNFILRMIRESKKFSYNVLWFTVLVSKQANLNAIYAKLKEIGAYNTKTIPMSTGNKTSRIVAWTFHNKENQDKWVKARW